MKWPLFITLTIPNVADAWDGLRQMRAAFGRFRRSKFWNDSKIMGGVASIEITNRGNGWHPHLHALADCKWLAVATPPPCRGDAPEVVKSKCVAAQAELSSEWAKCIGERCGIVWVSRADAGGSVEVLKYAADPGTMLDSDGELGELIDAIDQHRLISTWGNCYGIGRLVKELARLDRSGRPCGECGQSAWSTMEAAMRNGHADMICGDIGRAPWDDDE